MSKSPSFGIYDSPTDRDFEMAVSPRGREPGPVRRVIHREQESAGCGYV